MQDANAILLTTAKAAKLLGTHESSIKRWCNDGDLPSQTTSGGHRRIDFDALLNFADRSGFYTPIRVFNGEAKYIWHGLEAYEKRGDFSLLLERLLYWTEHRRLPAIVELFRYLGGLNELPLQTIFDQLLRPALYQVGDWWQAGEISISHEHIVSHTFQHGLYALNETRQQTMRRLDGSRRLLAGQRAVVGCAEGNLHEIAAFCIRSLLESLGWEVFYLGANVPTVEYLTMQRKADAGLVCVSYSPAANSGDALRDVRVLGDLLHGEASFKLVLGGANLQIDGGKNTRPFKHLRSFTAAEPFVAWLQEAK